MRNCPHAARTAELVATLQKKASTSVKALPANINARVTQMLSTNVRANLLASINVRVKPLENINARAMQMPSTNVRVNLPVNTNAKAKLTASTNVKDMLMRNTSAKVLQTVNINAKARPLVSTNANTLKDSPNVKATPTASTSARAPRNISAKARKWITQKLWRRSKLSFKTQNKKASQSIWL